MKSHPRRSSLRSCRIGLSHRARCAASLLALLLTAAPELRAQSASLPQAHWIWGDPSNAAPAPKSGDDSKEEWLLARTLELPAAPTRALLAVTADNHFRLSVNGTVAGRGDDWARLARLDLTNVLRAGKNDFLARVTNDGGPAGFLFALEVTCADGSRTTLVSDGSWRARPYLAATASEPLAADAPAARLVARYGASPWGELNAPPPPTFDALPGFIVTPVAEGFGSVVALADGGPNRWLANVEGGPIFALVDGDGDGAAEQIAPFTDTIKGCQGIHWQAGTTWFTGAGPDGHGLYRLADGATTPTKVVAFDGDLGEHGPHAIVPGPDGALYVALGNHARLGQPPADGSPYALTYEGHLLPRYVDPLGHATECQAPGGVVLRVEPESGRCELFAAGFRNHYDIAFDARGELFTFDSDMEWDVGLPWYRPVRIVHVVPGGEYGWRTGSTVWPNVAADSLPPSIEAGRGSPTGMCLATGTQFPKRFQGTLLAGDWSLGVIYAFRATPRGASYDMTADVLLRGHPLNVTDLAMDRDGSLLFAVGGRGTVGGVHRLRCVDPAASESAAPPAGDPAATTATALHRELHAAPLSRLATDLASPDRWRRFLAARELERRPAADVARTLAALKEPIAQAEAAIALARLQLAGRAPIDALDAEVVLKLGIVLLEAVNRQAPPAPDAEPAALRELRHATLRLLQLWRIAAPEAAFAGDRLLAGFPCRDAAANRDWAQLIAQANPAGAAELLWRAFTQEPSREQKIAYAYALRCIETAWPDGARVELHRWLEDAARANTGGMSYVGYLTNIRDAADRGLTDAEKALLEQDAEERRKLAASASRPPAVAAEPRDFDRVLTFVERTLHAPHRSAADGGLLYQQLCSKCHKRGEIGVAVGPELTTVGSRFGARDLLEALLAPSRTISDQYRGENFFLANGDIVTGLPLLSDAKRVVVVNPTGDQVELPVAQITRRRPAMKSVMPEGLADGLTLEQISDLTAWLLAPTAVAPATAASWQPFLEGRSFDASSEWRLVDGVLQLPAAAQRAGAGLAFAEPQLADFAFEFEARLAKPDDTAAFLFRQGAASADPSSFLARAGASYATHAGASTWGRLTERNGRGLLVQPRQEIWWPLPERSGWNHFLVTAVGPRITVQLNGSITVDTEDRDGRRDGAFGFEVDGGGGLELRHMRVRALPSAR